MLLLFGLLKGQLLGVDIIASICGFTYEYTVWHEKVPLGKPNTATINIDFCKVSSTISRLST